MNQKLIKNEAMQEYNIISSAHTTQYSNWLKDGDQNLVFYDGGQSQWTKSEIDAMDNRGQYTLTLNATRKAILGMVGMFTSAKPKFRCDPVGSTDNALAGIATALIDHSYRISGGTFTIAEILLNAFKTNVHYAVVRAIGNDKVIFEGLSYRDVIVQNASNMMFTNAEWIAVKKYVPIERVQVLFGVKPTMTTFPTEWITSDTTYVSNSSKLRLFDDTKKYVLVFERFIKFYENINGKIRSRIKKRVLLGYEHVYEDILPESITEYPIIPMYAELSNNQFVFGEVHFLKDNQRFMNKMINEVVRSAQAMSSGKVIVRKNEIPNGDADEFADNWSLPGAVVVLQPGAQRPDIVNPTPLNGAYFDMFQNAYAMFSGLNISGDAQKFNDLATDPARKQEWDSMITASLRMPATIFDAFLGQLGKVILQHYQAYIDNDNLVKILDAMEDIRIVKSAQDKRLDPTTDEGIRLWSDEMEKNKMSLEEIDETVVTAKKSLERIDAIYDFLNNPDILYTDIQIETESYTSTNSMNKFKMMYQLAEKGMIPPEIIVDYLPVDDKDAIKLKIERMRNASRQVDSLNKQVEELSKQLEKLSEENRKIKDRSIDVQNQAKHDYMVKDAMLKKLKAKIDSNVNSKIQSSEAKLALKELLLDLKEEMRENPQIVKDYIEQYIGE